MLVRSSVFSRPVDKLADDQTPARMLANAAQYGKPGTVFSGYSGTGFGTANWYGCTGWSYATYSYPIYVCSNADPKQKVGLWARSGGNTYPLGTQFENLQSYVNAVPIPDKTRCPRITGKAPYSDVWAGGNEQACFIVNADTGQAWEFFFLSNTGPASIQQRLGCTWTAQMAAYYPDVSKSDGVLPNLWGARATSLSALGGLVTLQDLRDIHAGVAVGHAVAISSPINSGAHVAPATRSDGQGGNKVPSIPAGFPNAGQPNPAYGKDVTVEGQRFRFVPDVDLSGCTHPVSRALGEWIRDYGLMIVDTSQAVGFYIEDPRTLGSPYHSQGAEAVDPWALDWPAGQMLYTGSFNPVTNQLPWDQLQLLEPVAA